MLVVLIMYILNAVHICTKSTDIMFPYTAKILQYTENSKHIFPEKELRSHSPNSYIHVSVWIYIFPRSVCLFCCRKTGGPIVGIYKTITDT
jgi:hypothetical protein